MANAADKPTAQHPPAPLATPTDLGDDAVRDIPARSTRSWPTASRST